MKRVRLLFDQALERKNEEQGFLFKAKSLGESWKTCLDPGLRMSWKEAAFPEDNRTTRLARGYLAQPKV